MGPSEEQLAMMPPSVAALYRLTADELEAFMEENVWYVEENDLIGGWCITVLPLPPSTGNIPIADFLSENTAKNLVAMHNNKLKGDAS